MEQIRRLHVYENAEAMQQDLVPRIAQLAKQCIQKHNTFHIALAGGTTPQAIYRGLCNIDTDWQAWQVYFGDERCLAKGDLDRNDSMAQTVWLSQVTIPDAKIHTVPAELGAEAGAQAYAKVIAGVQQFDLVLLGLGEDGHTASLFPGQMHDPQATVVAVHEAPKPPPDRISLSAATLSKSHSVWFLVTGENKRQALSRWQQGEVIPASTICPSDGIDIFTDVDLNK